MLRAVEIIEEMIREEARIATEMAVAFPHDFERLNASTGIGIRLQALQDAKHRIIRSRAKELENA